MRRIAVDMDEVLADFTQQVLDVLNNKTNQRYTRAHLNEYSIEELYPNELDYLVEQIHTDHFFRTMQVIEGSQVVLERLSKHYEIVIATAAMEVPNSFAAKFDWLREHFPFLNPNLFIFCGNKKVVQADYLIDDNIQQLTRFEGRGVMYTAMQNIELAYDVRVDNWHEVEMFFMEELSVKA
ncbi:5' nucleotidase, NT5C type [Sporosarcina sp. ITBMC105]